MTNVQLPWEIVDVCQAALSSYRAAEGDPPTFQAIERAARPRGVARPEEHVLAARGFGYLGFEGDLTSSTRILLPVLGHFLADPHDRLLHHYFVSVVRSLVDRLDRETLLAPTEARPVIVFAHEMEQLRGAMPVEIKMLGRLLDVEPIGRVGWTADASSPWYIEIDFTIRDFASIASIPDYLDSTRQKTL